MNSIRKRRKNKITRGIARILAASLLFGVIGSHAETLTITAQAAESGEMNDACVLSLGGFHSAVIKADGSLWMWGSNYHGALGNGTEENSSVPIQIMEDVSAVSLGYQHSAAIKADGSLWMWGDNQSGELGNGTSQNSNTPIKIMDDVSAVSLGDYHSAAIKTDGSLWMWGDNQSGELGNGTMKDSRTPIKIMDDVSVVSLGAEHSAAIKTDGSLWMWGSNGSWELGDGTTLCSDTPIKIMENVSAVSLGANCSAAIKTDGSLWVWGEGRGIVLGSRVPIQIMEDVSVVSLGAGHSAAIKTDSSLWMWGSNYYGALGNGTDSSVPMQIMENVSAVSLGVSHSAAIKNDGSLWMWGNNSYGKLGNGTEENSLIPIQIMPPGSVEVPDSSSPAPIEPPINMEVTTKPQIQVVDSNGDVIVDAEITYNGKTFTTSERGIAELDNYIQGQALTISKTGYIPNMIFPFIKSKSGRSTYMLSPAEDKLANITGSVILSMDNERIDLLTKEAQINTYYSNQVFSIRLSSYYPYDKYLLYSGSKKIDESSNGIFSNLRSGSFTVGQPVYLDIYDGDRQIRKKLNLNIVYDKPPMPPMDGISISDGFKVVFPDDVPLVGGRNFEIDAEYLPVTCKYKSDGTLEVGINIFEKDFDEIYSKVKKLNKDTVSSFLGVSVQPELKTSIKPDFKVVGYLESNVKNPDYLQGKLFAEFSVAFSNEYQLAVGPVPVVVELTIEGKINADGSIKWSAKEGIGGSVGIGGGIGLEVYAGVGVANVASAGVYGGGEFGLHWVILPVDKSGVDKLYLSGQLGLKAKVFGNDFPFPLLEGKWYIIDRDEKAALVNNEAGGNDLSLDNYEAYTSLDRSYLTADGEMPEWQADAQATTDGNVDEKALQSAVCLDIVPQVVRMGDTVMLFYLTDAGTERNAANRSLLVYSLWDGTTKNWSEPKAVLDDGTADFSPDFYTDGEKIYAVWQNAEERLTDEMTLNEITDSLTLHAAVYDKEQDQFTDLGSIESENGLFQQNPQIVADGDTVSVYWYENKEDNVLGLSGTNKIYQAILQDAGAVSDKMKIQSVEEESDAEDVDVEDLDTEEVEYNGIFKKYVAVETDTETVVSEENETDETVSGNTLPEETEPEETEPEESEPEETTPEETVSEETEPEETVSGNTVSENTIQNTLYSTDDRAVQPWAVTFLQEENDCIVSSDAGEVNGEIGYAYAAGKLDALYNISSGKVIFLKQGGESSVLGDGKIGKVKFTPVYADTTLSWYQDGDIYYLAENGTETALFGESRLSTASYTLLSDGAGNPEVIFPVNRDGKSNLYRIGYENGAFQAALQVTDQEDYIQYVDGFIDGDETILVYNRMKVDNDTLEEISNSLYTGTISHSYYDIVMQSAGSMIWQDTETNEDVLEINARLYNNGTIRAENLSLTLADAEGTELETVSIDTVLEPGETAYGTAVFDLSKITEAAEYTLTVSMPGVSESSTENNSSSLILGEASLQVDAEMIAVADTRTVQVGIRNTGLKACGGTVSVRDVETGTEYCSSEFDPIVAGTTVFVEIAVDNAVFEQKDSIALEVVVTPDQEGVESVSDFVMATAPSYEVNFVTDTENSTVYAGYGKTVEFPVNPAKDGAYFAGWYDTRDEAGGTLYTEETPIKSDVTLYARFVQGQTDISLENCSVTEIPTQLYTGKALKPAVTVKWGSEVLKVNKDYTVSYLNNKEQGKATVAITGKGKYSGTITRTFSILYPISKVSVKAIPAVNFTGENHTPDVTVTYNKKTLVKNTDYTVTYTNNRNAGTAGITITGKGKYTGTKTVTFQIKGTAITGMVFEKIPDVPYNGSATRPIVTIRTKDGTQLQAGADYRLIYENTVNKGTATVTVVGNGNYTGTKKLTYKVVAKPLTEAMISGVEDAVYTGSTIKPAVTVKDGGAELAAGKDYTVSYSKNKAVGTATVTVKGKGNYSGTVKLPFAISPLDLAQAQTSGKIDVRVSDIAYTGKAVKPKVQIYEVTDGKEKKIPAGGYTISYANNIEMGTGTVTVTGKGGYTGTATAQFRIVEKARMITASNIKIDAIPTQTFTGARLEPAVRIIDKSDKTNEITLVKDTDYEVTYKNSVNVGKATVTIKGIGSYAGSKDVTFKIDKRSIGNKAVLGEGFEIGQIPDEKYTGYALKPDVVVKDQGKTLVLGTDYKLSYKNNTKIGTASVTLTGIGNYSGSYNTIRFNIVSWDYNDLQARIEEQVYTGKAIKPQVAFYTGGEAVTLKSGTAVKIEYKDNKNAGTATATITGKGELKNMTPITVSFEIEPADVTDAVVGKISNQTLKGVAVTPIPKVKVGKNTLKAERDFTVSYLRNGVKGEAEVIITGTGNYTGECRKSFIVQ